MSLLVKLYVFLALLVDLDLFFKSFLSVLSDFSIFLFEGLAFLIDFGKFFLNLNHQLLISDGHYISKEDELVMIIEDIHYVLGRFFFKHLGFDLFSKFVQVGFEDFMSFLPNFDLLLPIFICYKLSEEFFQSVFSIRP